jgi:hypothetical protein
MRVAFSFPSGKLTVRKFLSTIALIMTAIAKKLDAKMSRWKPETAKKVEKLVAEIIELADSDALDVVRSPQVEQEVLDILDGRNAG